MPIALVTGPANAGKAQVVLDALRAFDLPLYRYVGDTPPKPPNTPTTSPHAVYSGPPQ
jgi:hypothetical protein